MNETFTNYFKRLSKKSMARMGVVGITIIIASIFLFVSIPISSSPVIEKDTYELGEKIRVDLNEEYKLKIITPSNTYIKKGNDKFVFKPSETGNYTIVFYSEEGEKYDFQVIEKKRTTPEKLPDKNLSNFTEGNVSKEDTMEKEKFSLDKRDGKTNKPIIEESFSLRENPQFEFYKEEKKGLSKVVGFFESGLEGNLYNEEGDLVESNISISEKENKIKAEVEKRALKPGRYTLKIEGLTESYEEDFTWGLISLNTKKSRYKPNETSNFEIVVLDSEGKGVCDAPINLQVTSPSGEKENIEKVEESERCGLYYADYNTSKEGNYTINVSTVVDNYELNFSSYFIVERDYDYEIIRDTKSMIDPTIENYFDVSINISSLNSSNKEGMNINETVPGVFDIFDTDAEIIDQGNTKRLLWEVEENKTEISYSYSVPYEWPYLYKLGPLEVNDFKEARPWYVAVDPSVSGSPSSCSGDWQNCENVFVDDGDYATGVDGDIGDWNDFGFDLEDKDIKEVIVTVKTHGTKNHDLALRVWDNVDGTYLQDHDFTSGTTECSETQINITDDTDWTSEKINNIGLQYEFVSHGGGPPPREAYICYTEINVTYEEPELGDFAVLLNEPENNEIVGNSTVEFNYTPIEEQDDIEECSLWDNSSGVFQKEKTNSTPVVNNESNFFYEDYSDDSYLWNVQCCNSIECVFYSSNRTFTVDTTPPSVNLVSPENDSLIESDYDLNFSYNVSDNSPIEECSLYIDGEVKQTQTDIEREKLQYFEHYLPNGTYLWSVSCENAGGQTEISENRTVNVDINRSVFENRFYETGDQDFTNNELAKLHLENSQTGNQNSADFAIDAGQTVEMMEAISPYTNYNGAVILGGSDVVFNALFTETSSDVEITWELYKVNYTNEELICQQEDVSVDTGTVEVTASDCITEDIYLEEGDRFKLEMSGHNTHARQTRSVTHVWDGSAGSYVELDIQTQGEVTTDLIYPEEDKTLVEGERMNMSCEVLCSEGNCRNTNIYAQYNNSEGWQNITNSGELILAEGEENPQDLGDVGTEPVIANFTITGNIESANDIRCKAVSDYSEKTGNTTREITVVSAEEPPSVELLYPESGYWFNTSEIFLEYNTSISDGSLENSTLILNEKPNITDYSVGEGINNFTTNLEDGIYNWTVNVTSSLGLTGTDEKREFYIDTTPPNTYLDSPENNEILQTAEVEFNLTVYDNMDSVLSCDLILNGETEDSFNANSGELVSRELVLDQGDYLWNVTCLDEAGNKNISETRNFTIEITPPGVDLITEDNRRFDSSEIVLEYNATDEDDIASSTLILNGEEYMNNQTPIENREINNFTVTGLEDGIYNWSVNVTNIGGLTTQSEKRTFYKDTKEPEISLNLPENNNLFNTSSVNFNFTATDELSETLDCTLKVGETEESFNADNGTLTNRLLEEIDDGEKIWNVTCNDGAGNTGVSENRNITIMEKPSVESVTSNNTFFNSTPSNLEYIPSDNSDLSSCDLYINGEFNQSNQTPIENGGVNSFEIDFNQGIYDWYVVCQDTIGLENQSETRSFGIDWESPFIESISPEDGAVLETTTVEFQFNTTDNIVEELYCNLTVNGEVKSSLNATSGNITSEEIEFEEGGDYLWNATCNDEAGNTNISETRNFTLSFPPRVYLVSPDNNTAHNSSNIAFDYYVEDDNDNIVNSTLILNGEEYMNNQTPIENYADNNFSVTGLEDGIYNWTVLVRDDTGLDGKGDERLLTIDTKSPEIELLSPEDNETIDWNEVPLEFNATDNFEENLTCGVYVEDSLVDEINTTSGESASVNATRQDGNYSWYVSCYDKAGNTNISEERNFTIDAPPKVELFEPENESITNSSYIEFVYKPKDAIDITECSLYLDGELNQTDEDPDNNEENNFTVSGINEGKHNWTVECTDDFIDNNIYAPNESIFYIDQSGPNIELMNPENNSGVDYNQDEIIFEWNATDEFSDSLECNLTIDGNVERSNVLVTSGEIYDTDRDPVSNLSLGEHSWNVTCWDYWRPDSITSNINASDTWSFNYTYPDFQINSSLISFNNSEPSEGEKVLVNATINNLGGAGAEDVIVGFYNGDPATGGEQIGENKSLDFKKYGSNTTSVVWDSEIGSNEIFVVVDPPTSSNGSFDEWNESNNKDSKNITIGSWNYFYGDIDASSNFTLSDNTSVSIIRWDADNFEDGNIYVSDYESSISWADLQAISKNISGEDISGDFSDIDTLLNMSSYNDSVSNVYTEGGEVKNRSDFLVFKEDILGVPITESTNNSNFTTGILWDMDDDTDGEYSQTDKEDLIFVTKINKNTRGAYGVYDYELRVPAKLREYRASDTQSAVFYVELKG